MPDEISNEEFVEGLRMIRKAKFKAMQNVNRELISLYWEFGKYVSQKVVSAAWGKGVVEQLADYLKNAEPGLTGFSNKNIWRMKQFYETYVDNEKLSPLVRELSWTNNLTIMSRCKDGREREFYLTQAISENYSKRELERQISSGAFERARSGSQKLSPVVREIHPLATEVFKDQYSLEFIGLNAAHDERDLRNGLVGHLKEFILELGRDFSFVGQEYRLQVGNSDFYADLLFYHRELQCLVVFELKVDKFRPEHMGQLEFYLEALDRDVRKPHEKPSIGVLLCKDKDDEVVEYALSRSVSPTVISQYETKLIPKDLLRAKLHEFAERENSDVDTAMDS